MLTKRFVEGRVLIDNVLTGAYASIMAGLASTNNVHRLQKELERECTESEKSRNLYKTLLQEHESVRYQLAEARLYIDRLRIGIDSPFLVRDGAPTRTRNAITGEHEGTEVAAAARNAGLTLPVAPLALDQVSHLRRQAAILEDSLAQGDLPFHSVWAGLVQLQQLHNQLASEINETETTEDGGGGQQLKNEVSVMHLSMSSSPPP